METTEMHRFRAVAGCRDEPAITERGTVIEPTKKKNIVEHCQRIPETRIWTLLYERNMGEEGTDDFRHVLETYLRKSFYFCFRNRPRA
jgi:hypothetical protein